MIYPIVAYGATVLRKKCDDIKKGEMDVKQISDNMFETMYSASGVGLAGPQVNLPYRIFIADGEIINKSAETEEEIDQDLVGFKKTFINAQIIEETGTPWAYEEGCLSIPGIRADVIRKPVVTIRYFDTDWVEHTETFKGMAARIIQHEYDHIEGILFTDYLAPLKKQMLKKKLGQIQKGVVDADYKMKFL